jgi:hypothetical protein
MSESVLDDEVARVSAATRKLIGDVTERLQVDCIISDNSVLDLSKFLLRDIQRIQERQKNKVSSIKFAGYWGFWIRKLKPISRAFRRGDDKNDPFKEIIHINELVALEISICFILRIGAFAEHNVVIDVIRGACKERARNACNGVDCVKEAAIDFMKFQNALNLKYLIHSMRHRTFGPHHFVTNLDHLVFGACRKAGGI